MKVHTDLKELLEDFEIWLNEDYDFNEEDTTVQRVERFLSSNSLALGKPEPLAKNKQTESFCPHCGSKDTFINVRDNSGGCYDCLGSWEKA